MTTWTNTQKLAGQIGITYNETGKTYNEASYIYNGKLTQTWSNQSKN